MTDRGAGPMTRPELRLLVASGWWSFLALCCLIALAGMVEYRHDLGPAWGAIVVGYAIAGTLAAVSVGSLQSSLRQPADIDPTESRENR